jgi:DNA polymerase III epsilon subunit-like protein
MTATASANPFTLQARATHTLTTWARLGSDAVVIDTETTGVEPSAEIVSVAVCDMYGRVLLDTLVRPTKAIPLRATQIHGLRDEDVQHAPSWPDVWPQLEAVLAGRLVLAYNCEFDLRLVRQTLKAHPFLALGMPTELVNTKSGAFELPTSPVLRRWHCAMKAYQAHAGLDRWPKLVDACAAQGVPVEDLPGAHGALGDVLRTVRLIKAVARGH